MKAISVWLAATLVSIGGYFVFRAVVTGCAGTVCDAYIPFSVLIPVLILAMVAATGVMALTKAGRWTTWFVVLLTSTVVGFLGPLIALIMFRDSPDLFVLVATLVELLALTTVLVYSVFGRRQVQS